MSLLTKCFLAPAAAAWAAAGRDVVSGMAIVARTAVGLAGFAALSAAFALLTSEQARDQAVSAALMVASAAATQLPAVVVEAPEVVEAKSGRWSDWLSTVPAGKVEPQQENVTRYLSRRYRVAENAVRQIVGEAFSTGRSIGLDPMLILAVTAIESSMNPFAQSSMGAQGLMQVMTRVHSERFVSHGGDHAALDPIANLKVGSEILKDLIQRGGSVERGLQLYVGAGNLPDDGGYSARVLGEAARIRIAAGGDIRSALAAGLRADTRVESKPAAVLVPTAVDAKPETVPATSRQAT
jgi:soluble lytic murein transglycosylase-like protein